MTKQEYRDLLVKTSLEGGFPSAKFIKGGSSTCLYRGPNGKKCAIGHLIPDELYEEKMENMSVEELLYRYVTLFRYLPDGVGVRQLALLQEAHDNHASRFPDGWDYEGFMWDHESFVYRVDGILGTTEPF